MVIKIWYSTGKSMESQDWMVICSNGTWEEHFYFCFIVFLSIYLTQVFMNSLLTIKVSMFKKKKNIFPLPTLEAIYTSHLAFSENTWDIDLCMASQPPVELCVTVSRCGGGPSYDTDPWPRVHLHSSCYHAISLDSAPSKETRCWETLCCDSYLVHGSTL